MRHTQMIPKTSHSPQKGLAHLAQIDGIEKEVFWVGRDVDFNNPVLCSTKKNPLRTKRMCRADWKCRKDLPNLRLGCSQRVEEGFPNSLHGCYKPRKIADGELRDRI